MVREVTFADSEQALNRCLQFVVNPDAAHGVVAGGEDHHGGLVRVVVGNHLVHVEEVAVAVAHDVLAEALDGVLEVDVDAVVVVDSIGNPKKIASAAARISQNPRDLMMAENVAKVIALFYGP